MAQGVQQAMAALPPDAMQVSPSVAVADGGCGGMVFVNGFAAYCWDAGDDVSRRFAAVGAAKLPDTTDAAVAEAFSTTRVSLWRWRNRATGPAGPAGLVADRPGPRGPSKLTGPVRAKIARLRDGGATIAAIAEKVGVSTFAVRTALATDHGAAAGAPDAAGGPDADEDGDGRGDVAVAGGADSGDIDAGAGDAGEDGDGDIDAGTGDAGAPAGGDDDDGAVGGVGVLPVLPAPADRSGERALARWGLIDSAPPVFAPAGRVPLAGLFLALPGLRATGLLQCAAEVYGGLKAGFYGLDAMLIEAVLRALAGEPRAEGAGRVDPADLGRVLGLDRAPEVKTVRRRLGQLAARGLSGELLETMAAKHAATHDEATSIVYVDGHVRTYHGTRKIQKTHVSRLRLPAPATAETWITDGNGDPVWVVMSEPGASLAAEIRRLMPDVRRLVGDDRRVLVGFDRGGWSPALFKDMAAAGFDVLTWRKAPCDDVAAGSFTDRVFTDDTGRVHTYRLADTTVELETGDGRSDDDQHKGGAVTLRQVTKQDDDGAQAHIVTSRADLDAGEVCYRMASRWREENYFRFARAHFALDAHDTYAAADDDADRMVPNPDKKTSRAAVAAAARRLRTAETEADRQFLDLRSPEPGTSSIITSATANRINQPIFDAEEQLEQAKTAHRDTPARLPLGQVRPGQQILDTETKLVTHAIRMAAYNTQAALARTVRTATGYAKADDEAHALIRAALARPGDIDPRGGILHIRLDPLPTRRETAAVGQLCDALTATETTYPGTTLKLHYTVKPHH
jgi:transposase-like protein